MDSNLNQIISILLETLEAQEKTIKDLTKQVESLEAHLEENYPLNPIDLTIEKVNLIFSNYLNGRPTP